MIGPLQRAVLAEIAGPDGLTASEIAGQLGRPAIAIQQAVARLARNRCAEMTSRQPGSAAGVWIATGTGLRVLGVPVPLPGHLPADERPGRAGECPECGYLRTAAGHRIACEVAA